MRISPHDSGDGRRYSFDARYKMLRNGSRATLTAVRVDACQKVRVLSRLGPPAYLNARNDRSGRLSRDLMTAEVRSYAK